MPLETSPEQRAVELLTCGGRLPCRTFDFGLVDLPVRVVCATPAPRAGTPEEECNADAERDAIDHTDAWGLGVCLGNGRDGIRDGAQCGGDALYMSLGFEESLHGNAFVKRADGAAMHRNGARGARTGGQRAQELSARLGRGILNTRRKRDERERYERRGEQASVSAVVADGRCCYACVGATLPKERAITECRYREPMNGSPANWFFNIMMTSFLLLMRFTNLPGCT